MGSKDMIFLLISMLEKQHRTEEISCLLGGAIGDALGAPIEFMSIQEIRSRYGKLGLIGYVEHEGSKGEFTDDTQMTLFTAEGMILARKRVDQSRAEPEIVREVYFSYLRWLYTQGYKPDSLNPLNISDGKLVNRSELFKIRAPGITCLSSLLSGKIGTIQEPINSSKGCGGVMRVAPVGLKYYENLESAFQLGCEIAATTHGHPCGYLSAGFLASVIAYLMQVPDLESAINQSIVILQKYQEYQETLAIIEKAITLAKNVNEKDPSETEIPEIIESLGSGWTGEEALAISIFCSLLYQQDYTKGVLAAVNHSGDSDSTGSITGNILGLINGIGSIPEIWKNNLLYSDIVIETAAKMGELLL